MDIVFKVIVGLLIGFWIMFVERRFIMHMRITVGMHRELEKKK